MEEVQGAGPFFYIKGAVPEDEGPSLHHLCPELHGIGCETFPAHKGVEHSVDGTNRDEND